MSENHRYSIRPAPFIFALAAISCVALTACSSTGSTATSAINPATWIKPYKIDVIQGNFISSEQVDALKPGMTRAQVRDVLGTPLLSDLFHGDRWDYVFTMKRRNVEPQSLKLAAFFKGDVLDHFEGDKMPSEAEFISKIDSGRKLRAVPVLEATEAELNKAAEKSPVPKGTATAATPPSASATPPASYPPLESPGAVSGSTCRIAVAGASGRMGRMLIEAIRQNDSCVLAGALDVAGSASAGTDASAFLGHTSGVLIQADIREGLKDADVLIDFTRPEGTMAHLAACRELGVKLVIGTTGFSDAQKAEIAASGKDIAIVMAPNMSVGVNVTLKLLEMAAKAMATGFDIEIIEAHHRHKIDAPSGTALKMGEVIAGALGRDLKESAVYSREGITGERDPSTIGFASVRGGDIVGDHTVMFLGTGERIEITHKSSSRATYAQGSLRAALFLQTQTSGLFDMFDVLKLN